mgnify:CR=1 FL=1|tara:strand:- start:163 stop:402 length:240 start_codon:yes stop_codon:yes gene_type:complete
MINQKLILKTLLEFNSLDSSDTEEFLCRMHLSDKINTYSKRKIAFFGFEVESWIKEYLKGITIEGYFSEPYLQKMLLAA